MMLKLFCVSTRVGSTSLQNSPGEASTNNGMGCGDLRHVVVLSFANID